LWMTGNVQATVREASLDTVAALSAAIASWLLAPRPGLSAVALG